jgi:hypothetical protein
MPHGRDRWFESCSLQRRVQCEPNFRLAETVRNAFNDLGVAQTTIDLFRRVVEDRERDRGRQQGVLAWDGEHYQMIELGPEAIEGRITQAREVLEFAESLTVVPAEAAAGIKDEAKQLFEELDEAYLDSVLAAKGSDRILLSDDGPFRCLAAEAGSVKTVWTQAAVSFAVSQQKVSAENARSRDTPCNGSQALPSGTSEGHSRPHRERHRRASFLSREIF